jgi:hypothetical protein
MTATSISNTLIRDYASLVTHHTFPHIFPPIHFYYILFYCTMAQNTLLSDNQLAFKELEQSRRDLIVNILEEQRELSIEIEKLSTKLEANKAMLAKLADKQPEQQPEGVSI